jgi:putative transposase
VSYWRLYYHLLWATKLREPLINESIGEVIRRSTQHICTENGVLVHAIGTMPDHVHLAVSIPPRLSVSSFMQRVKGNTSHLVNRNVQHPTEDWFVWQPEYGVLSFGEASLVRVVEYVENETTHHAEHSLWSPFERLSDHADTRIRSLEEAL